MSHSFEDMPWHDAVILAIQIDRRRPGAVDEVSLAILWPDDRRSRLTFRECFGLEARMNFGIVAAETVRSAIEVCESDALRAARDAWGRLGVDLADLRGFEIKTNSTASTITILARRWTDDHEDRGQDP